MIENKETLAKLLRGEKNNPRRINYIPRPPIPKSPRYHSSHRGMGSDKV